MRLGRRAPPAHVLVRVSERLLGSGEMLLQDATHVFPQLGVRERGADRLDAMREKLEPLLVFWSDSQVLSGCGCARARRIGGRLCSTRSGRHKAVTPAPSAKMRL